MGGSYSPGCHGAMPVLNLQPIAEAALQFVSPHATVGLGTGSAASAFIRALGERVQAGFPVRGLPTSVESERLARQFGIPLIDLEQIDRLDLAVDGADEVDPHLNLIKGYGGALLREKVVAAAAKRLIILVGAEKLVPALGTRGKLPVEVVPFAWSFCQRELARHGLVSQVRMRQQADAEQPFLTDNGNWILDCQIGPLDEVCELESRLRGIPGVVGTGLFLTFADDVLVQHADHIEHRQRSHLQQLCQSES